jgi:hypothetical protein
LDDREENYFATDRLGQGRRFHNHSVTDAGKIDGGEDRFHRENLLSFRFFGCAELAKR